MFIKYVATDLAVDHGVLLGHHRLAATPMDSEPGLAAALAGVDPQLLPESLVFRAVQSRLERFRTIRRWSELL